MTPRLSALAAALLVFAVFPPAASAADVQTELKALVDRINAKLEAGQHTEAALAADLAQFDALLAAHKGETSDEVARILFAKATLYLQVLDNPEKCLGLLRQLKADFPSSSYAQRLEPALFASLELEVSLGVGKVFPDFTEQDLDGKPLSVANYKGKVVLLDFWATWCGPCVAELPNVVAAYKKYHARGFEVIGVSLDQPDTRQKLIDFAKANEMTWPQFYDGGVWDSKLARRYGVGSIPTTFLIDGAGRIIAKNLHGPELDEALEKALAKK